MFLSFDAANFINGHMFRVDGGMTVSV
ncbi:hypothetical protein [Komagataeibacter medellinensis]